jgi:hypothetical protein
MTDFEYSIIIAAEKDNFNFFLKSITENILNDKEFLNKNQALILRSLDFAVLNSSKQIISFFLNNNIKYALYIFNCSLQNNKLEIIKMVENSIYFKHIINLQELCTSAREGYTFVLKYLIDNKHFNYIDDENYVFEIAVNCSQIETVKYFFSLNHFYPEIRDNSAIRKAVNQENKEIVKLL